MFKLTLTTALALYVGFVVWGQPADTPAIDQPADVQVASAETGFDRPQILTGAEKTAALVTRAAVNDVLVPDASAIVAATPAPEDVRPKSLRLIGEPLIVSLVEPNAPLPAPTPEATEQASNLYVVTGSRVNMRNGPSVSNTVVDSLVAGTLTEVTGEERNGWVPIRDVETGQTGFMALRFLSPA